MRTLLLTVAACAAMIVGGIALATVSGPAGSLVALIGFIGFAGLVMYSGFRAWRNDPGLYYSPRKARQEWRAEQEAARRAEQRKAGRGQQGS